MIATAATSTLVGGGDIGRLHCGSTNVRTRANTAFSVYNGLQTSLTVKNYHGVTATAAYTFSRTIDNSPITPERSNFGTILKLALALLVIASLIYIFFQRH